MDSSEEAFEVVAGKLDESEEKLYQFFQELQKDSLKTIEEAARQVIGLSTTLLGLFFGVLAFQDSPAFLAFGDVKFFGTVSAGALLAGMFFAMGVIMPQHIDIPQRNLTRMRATLAGLYQRKTSFLKWAQILFGVGTLALLCIILRLLLF